MTAPVLPPGADTGSRRAVPGLEEQPVTEGDRVDDLDRVDPVSREQPVKRHRVGSADASLAQHLIGLPLVEHDTDVDRSVADAVRGEILALAVSEANRTGTRVNLISRRSSSIITNTLTESAPSILRLESSKSR